jgi:diguanylate cyclase
MSPDHPNAGAAGLSSPAGGAAPAQLAKGALRRLAMSKLEPTPANYARAYADEAGERPFGADALPTRARPHIERLVARVSDDAAQRQDLMAALMDGRFDELPRVLDRNAGSAVAQSQAWAQLIDRVARGLERGSRHWTGGRKKESLQRVLDGSRSDGQRLQQRLRQLLQAWESDTPDEPVEAVQGTEGDAAVATPSVGAAAATAAAASAAPAAAPAVPAPSPPAGHQARVIDALEGTVRAGLPGDDPRAVALADELAVLAERIAKEGATIVLAEGVTDVCLRARRLFGLRQELVDELQALCRSLADGITDLAEDGSWAQGQSQSLRQRLDDATGARAVRAARQLLTDTRERQRSLSTQRSEARDALKLMIQQMLSELGELDQATGHFNHQVLAHASAVEAADSLEGLTEVVRGLVTDSRAVHEVVAGARDRLTSEHARASALESQVRGLESELRRLSDEVSTDALTQVANRRGLAKAFEAERLRVERDGVDAAPLAIGLLDIDNFKKLNDTLGHAAGDVALKSLAARVKEWLRPVDHVARFGGEEFVVLLPGTPVAEAQTVLTRLQRKLSASLFMHDGREVFVTFSAGVSAWRLGEPLELALERADEGLYEAKRTGKNRTCVT